MNNNLLAKNRAFRHLWIGQIASQIGDRILQLTLAWWVLQSTGSALNLGVLMVVSSLPAIALAPLGGAVIDAFDRKRIMVAADLGRFLVVATMVALYYTHSLQMWQVYVAILLLSALAPFFNPAVPASIPHLVEENDRNEAMSLESMVSSMSGLVGPVIGGLLVGVAGIGGGLVFDALSFLVSAALVMTLPLPKGTGKTKIGEVFHQLQEGLSYAWRQTTVCRLLVGFAGVNLFLVPNIILVPMYVRLVLHGEAWMLGMLEGALSIGMIVASILASRLGEAKNKRWLILGALSSTSLALLLMSGIRNFAVALLLQALIGASIAGVNINMVMVFQRIVAPEMKGRFFSLVELVAFCSFPLAYLWVGVLAERTSVPLAYLVCGSGLVLILFYLASIKGLAQLGDAKEPEPALES